MPNFAVIESNSVINTIVADSLEVAQEVSGGRICVDITGTSFGIGDTWDGEKLIRKEIPDA